MERSAPGFTLVEILVVISIMVILVILVLPQFKDFNKSQNLKEGVEQLQSNLRIAQNNATSGVQCNSSTQASNWYIKFIDNSSYVFENTCPGMGYTFSKTYTLPSGVTIGDIKVESPDDPVTYSCTIVDPYNPLVQIEFGNISGVVNFISDNSCTVLANYNLKVKLSNNTGNASVVVEKGGAIYVSAP